MLDLLSLHISQTFYWWLRPLPSPLLNSHYESDLLKYSCNSFKIESCSAHTKTIQYKQTFAEAQNCLLKNLKKKLGVWLHGWPELLPRWLPISSGSLSLSFIHHEGHRKQPAIFLFSIFSFSLLLWLAAGAKNNLESFFLFCNPRIAHFSTVKRLFCHNKREINGRLKVPTCRGRQRHRLRITMALGFTKKKIKCSFSF